MITVHQIPLSPYNEKVKRLLNYKGIAFQERFWKSSEMKQVKRFNPAGKLPVLEHDGNWIGDSTDIVYYLEETFPDNSMIPADPHLAGMMHVLEDWADESLYFYEMHFRFSLAGNADSNIQRLVEHESAFLRWLLPKMAPRALAKITHTQGLGRKTKAQLLEDMNRHAGAIAKMLGDSEWLLGEGPTLADLAVYGMFKALADADIALEIVEKYEAVPAWMRRVEQTTDTRASQ